MGISEKSRCWILCEDLQTGCYIRYFLMEHGVNNRRIRQLPLPLGRCGEQYVREHLPIYLEKLRSRNYQRQLVLVICTDADTGSIHSREMLLENECRANGIPYIQLSDTALLFVPKRNIETWIRWYEGARDVNEEEDYGHMYRNGPSACRPAAIAMAKEFKRGELRSGSLPSIVDAFTRYCSYQSSSHE